MIIKLIIVWFAFVSCVSAEKVRIECGDYVVEQGAGVWFHKGFSERFIGGLVYEDTMGGAEDFSYIYQVEYEDIDNSTIITFTMSNLVTSSTNKVEWGNSTLSGLLTKIRGGYEIVFLNNNSLILYNIDFSIFN